jgi:Na+-driven multidrug efflux pump
MDTAHQRCGDVLLCCAALATVISQSLMFFMLITYIMVWKPHAPGTWDGLSWEALSGFKEFMSLALPGGTCV